jgi:uncharacterized phage protein gp47/JayE
MANVTSKSFTQLVTDMATAIQGRAAVLTDFTVGSILRSVVEAVAAVSVWLESLILLLLQTTRASTSSAGDLDTWVTDYGVTRLGAAFATGLCTFARFTNTLQAVIPIGALVQTSDGSQQFQVVIDLTNPAYNVTLGGYVIAPGASSVSVLVQAVVAGSKGNAAAGAITVIAQAMQYVDTVTNALAYTNGSDAESDTALRARFVSYIASLSKATKVAIGNAILSLQTGVSYSLVENYAYNGTYQPGFFYAVVDDGSGSPSAGFLSSVSNAIDAVRPFTSTFGVFAPVIITAGATMVATIAAGYDPTATKATARLAVLAYIQSLTLGQPLNYTRLAQVAYDASPGVINISSLLVNGATADIVATAQQRILAGVVTVS